MKQIVLLIVSLFFVVGMPFVGAAGDVNINIGVPPPPAPVQEPPPPLEFAGPPDVVVVPSGTSDVYLVPNMAGLYFSGGNWYRFHRGYWFRASLYSGPWITIREALVPGAVVVIPPDYVLGMPPGYHRIHYGDFHGHWRDWGRNHYWNRYGWYKDHSHHHWGGRDFRKPPLVGHHGGPGDRGKNFGGNKVGPGRKAGEQGKVALGGRTTGAGPKVGAQRAPGPGGPAGGKAGGAGSKAALPPKAQ